MDSERLEEIIARNRRIIHDNSISDYIKNPKSHSESFPIGKEWDFRPIDIGKAVAILREDLPITGCDMIRCPEMVNIPVSHECFESGEYEVTAMILTGNNYLEIIIPDSLEEIYFTCQTHNNTYFVTNNNPVFISKDGDLFSTDGKIWYHHFFGNKFSKPAPSIPEGVEVLKTGVLNCCYYTWDYLKIPSSSKLFENYALHDARINVIDFSNIIPKIEESAFPDAHSGWIKKIRINCLRNDISKEFLERVKPGSCCKKFHNLICKAPELNSDKEFSHGEIFVTDAETDSIVSLKIDELDLDSLHPIKLEVYDGVLSGTSILTNKKCESSICVYEPLDVVWQRIEKAMK